MRVNFCLFFTRILVLFGFSVMMYVLAPHIVEMLCKFLKEFANIQGRNLDVLVSSKVTGSKEVCDKAGYKTPYFPGRSFLLLTYIHTY